MYSKNDTFIFRVNLISYLAISLISIFTQNTDALTFIKSIDLMSNRFLSLFSQSLFERANFLRNEINYTYPSFPIFTSILFGYTSGMSIFKAEKSSNTLTSIITKLKLTPVPIIFLSYYITIHGDKNPSGSKKLSTQLGNANNGEINFFLECLGIFGTCLMFSLSIICLYILLTQNIPHGRGHDRNNNR